MLKSKDFEGEGGSISGDHLVAYTGSPESPTLLCAVHMEDLSSPGRMLSGLEEGMSAVVLPEWPSAFPALCLDRLCPTVMRRLGSCPRPHLKGPRRLSLCTESKSHRVTSLVQILQIIDGGVQLNEWACKHTSRICI